MGYNIPNHGYSALNSVSCMPLMDSFFFLIKHGTFFSVTRSTDYGSTYTKLNDKVGSRTVLSYLYVCPTNKQKVSPFLLPYPSLSYLTSVFLIKFNSNVYVSCSLPLVNGESFCVALCTLDNDAQRSRGRERCSHQFR